MGTPTKIEKIVRELEADALAEAQAHAASAAELAEALAEAEKALTEVEEVPEELLSAVKRGEDVSPNALIEARTSVEIAQAKVTGLKGRVAAATRTTLPHSASGADILVPAFEEVMKGVSVLTTIAPAHKVVEATKGLEGPVLVLCQEAPVIDTGGGFIAVDRIRGVFVRPAWAADIDPALLTAPCQKHGIRIRFDGRGGNAGAFQTFDVKIEAGVETIPFISRVDSGLGVNGAVQGFGHQVMQALGGSGGMPPVIRHGVYSFKNPHVRMEFAGLKVNEQVDEGMRTTTVEFGMHIFPGSSDPDYCRYAPHGIEACGFQPHLGRLTDIDIQHSNESDPRGRTISQRVAMTYVSRVK